MLWSVYFLPSLPQREAYIKSVLFCNPAKCSIMTAKLRIVVSFICNFSVVYKNTKI